MNKQNELLKIPESQIDVIQNMVRPLKYSSSSNLFYAGQIPIVAYLLLEGLIHFTKNGKVVNTFSRGNVIGLKELMNNQPVDVDAQILPGTKVCFIDRSTILGILEQKVPDSLNEVISKLIRIDSTVR
ncbi:cyclic nucleotide-binding domain-containing protein [Halobacteriovorax sp.]|uniref:cyclic nucleotide-binding domain-containing protein n=1 Tax=Halobacteriovorax sp. TaxID=2020862 RepID=UPI00356A5B34